MYYIVMEIGALPHLSVVVGSNGEARLYKSKASTKRWALANCAWRFQIHRW